jgi:hypothetical protein
MPQSGQPPGCAAIHSGMTTAKAGRPSAARPAAGRCAKPHRHSRHRHSRRHQLRHRQPDAGHWGHHHRGHSCPVRRICHPSGLAPCHAETGGPLPRRLAGTSPPDLPRPACSARRWSLRIQAPIGFFPLWRRHIRPGCEGLAKHFARTADQPSGRSLGESRRSLTTPSPHEVTFRSSPRRGLCVQNFYRAGPSLSIITGRTRNTQTLRAKKLRIVP